MFAMRHKSKEYLLVIFKILILGVTFVYIYMKTTQNETIDFKDFSNQLFQEKAFIPVLGFLVLTSLNWFFEILKWKAVVSEISQISFFTSLKQSLASLTVSLATPNRIGEYGAKTYFFKKEIRKQILLRNFFHNSFQMFVTVVFGGVGLLFFWIFYGFGFISETVFFKVGVALILIGIVFLLAFIFRKNTLIFKGLTLSNIYLKFKQISSKIKWKMMIFSVFRYLIFSYLFYRLLVFFGMEISFFEALPIIFSMYLLASVLPTIFIFDVVVRGGISLWLFGLAGFSEFPVLSTVFSMWMLNFVIPSIIGGYYLLSYKPSKL
ncbi:MAG: flippase-like domain-containing protein [Flavobacteriaceae bacterium]|nr:flippase-like domain-containing protein [Flavobacteriaceae bacterium]